MSSSGANRLTSIIRVSWVLKTLLAGGGRVVPATDETVGEFEDTLGRLRISTPSEHNQLLFEYLRVNPSDRFRKLVSLAVGDGATAREYMAGAQKLAIEVLAPGPDDLHRFLDAVRTLASGESVPAASAGSETAGVTRAADLILQAAAMAALGWPEPRTGSGRWWGGFYVVAAYLAMYARSTVKALSRPEWYLTDALR